MITKIELTNFKSHAHTVIEPGRVTALVGPNGAGKSNLLQAIKLLLDNARRAITNPSSVDNNYLDPSRRMIREGSTIFKVHTEGVDKNKHWSVDLSSASQEVQFADYSDKMPAWGIFIKGKIGYEEGFLATPIKIDSPIRGGHKIPQALLEAVGEYAYLKATAVNLAAPSYSEEIPPRISADGQGLASTIANLMTSESDGHQAVVEALQQIVPLVKNVRVRPAKVPRTEKRVISIDGKDFPFDERREVVGHEIIFDTQTIKGLPAHAMSDGTLLALGLITLLWSVPHARLILLDDIEVGLHPLAQRQLMQVLKDFAEKYDRQIILTSHSPYIIDELEAKDVWVMALDKEGITHAKRLSDHPDAEKVLSVLTTGEFASAYDEEWVVDEPKPAELVHG